jgi:hypothetical protein
MSGSAHAMILMLRCTALRIGDVALLSKDRLSRESGQWPIFLRTEKSGKRVFLPIPPRTEDVFDCVPLPWGTEQGCRHDSGTALVETHNKE